jgi:hypothetical protein
VECADVADDSLEVQGAVGPAHRRRGAIVSDVDRRRRSHPDLTVEGAVIAFESLKEEAARNRRPMDENLSSFYEALVWLAESVRELHFKVDRLLAEKTKDGSGM